MAKPGRINYFALCLLLNEIPVKNLLFLQQFTFSAKALKALKAPSIKLSTQNVWYNSHDNCTCVNFHPYSEHEDVHCVFKQSVHR